VRRENATELRGPRSADLRQYGELPAQKRHGR
jgi:hypothetical protein